MANWSLPGLGDLYTNFLQYLKDRDDDLAKMFWPAGATNIPVDTVRFNRTTKRFETWSGAAWVELIVKASDKYDINVDRVDGYDAGNANGNIPVSNGTVCTNLNADKVDGKDVSGGASQLFALDATALIPDTYVPPKGTSGTYRSVTTDAKGRVTAGSNPTTVAGYGLGDALQNGFVTAVTTGTNTYVCGFTPALSGYVANQVYSVRFAAANTGAATLNIDTRGAKTLKKQTGAGKVALVAGDIIAGGCYNLMYDGTDIIIMGLSIDGVPIDMQDKVLNRPEVKDYSETVNARGNLTGAQTIDYTLGQVVTGTVTGVLTLSITNPPATGKCGSLLLELTNPGAFAITWPAGTKWPGGTIPPLTAAGIDVFTFYTRDGGTTWRAAQAVKDSK